MALAFVCLPIAVPCMCRTWDAQRRCALLSTAIACKPVDSGTAATARDGQVGALPRRSELCSVAALRKAAALGKAVCCFVSCCLSAPAALAVFPFVSKTRASSHRLRESAATCAPHPPSTFFWLFPAFSSTSVFCSAERHGVAQRYMHTCTYFSSSIVQCAGAAGRTTERDGRRRRRSAALAPFSLRV